PLTGTVTGLVVDAATKAPLGGVVVSVEGSPVGPVASDAAAGQFLTRPLPPGPVKLQLTRDGYQSELVTAVVEAGKDTAVQVALLPAVKQSRFLVSTTSHRRPVAAT